MELRFECDQEFYLVLISLWIAAVHSINQCVHIILNIQPNRYPFIHRPITIVSIIFYNIEEHCSAGCQHSLRHSHFETIPRLITNDFLPSAIIIKTPSRFFAFPKNKKGIFALQSSPRYFNCEFRFKDKTRLARIYRSEKRKKQICIQIENISIVEKAERIASYFIWRHCSSK